MNVTDSFPSRSTARDFTRYTIAKKVGKNWVRLVAWNVRSLLNAQNSLIRVAQTEPEARIVEIESEIV